MKCKNCKEEKYQSIFNDNHEGIVINLPYLYGICFDCFELVPSYIPRRQVKRWLINNPELLLRELKNGKT